MAVPTVELTEKVEFKPWLRGKCVHRCSDLCADCLNFQKRYMTARNGDEVKTLNRQAGA